MFQEERDFNKFSWEDLGDIELGRPNLGMSVSVPVYRLLQYTLRDVLITKLGVKTANEILIEAGRLAGKEFCKNLLNLYLEFNEFIAQLQKVLKDLKVGILRVEQIDLENMEMLLTVAEDSDCSGLPISDETVCEYDEGFIAGILEAYTGKNFYVKEIDCWASGDRVCRFKVELRNEGTNDK